MRSGSLGKQRLPVKPQFVTCDNFGPRLAKQVSGLISFRAKAYPFVDRFLTNDGQLSLPLIGNTSFGDGTKYRQHAARPGGQPRDPDPRWRLLMCHSG